MKQQKIRQTFVLILSTFLLPIFIQAQEKTPKIDYSIRSNILDPDTLKGDQKKIFWHPYFLKLSSKEVEEMPPLKVKDEFAKLGIRTIERARFVRALTFFDTSMKNHKISCEQWEEIKYLVEPPKKREKE